MTYAQKLRDPRWQKKRLLILKRDKWKCTKCGDTETELHVHHMEYFNDPWEAQDDMLTTLCLDCHTIIESIKKKGGHDFNSIKIYKSNNWDGCSKIIFTSNEGVLSMEIYDNNEYLIGFNIHCDLPELKKLISYTLKHG